MGDFFIYLLKSAGLLTVFLVFYFILLKRDTSFNVNRRFLLGGLITSAFLPTVYFTKTVIIKAQQSQFQFSEAAFPVTEIVAQEPIISPLEIIAGIYFLGVVVMSLRFLLQLLSLFRVLYGGKFIKRENVNFIETPKKLAPFSFLNYVVYNPKLHSHTELEYILKHEKVHVKQVHTFDVLLANLNLIYQWFNPFAWLYLQSIQQNLEFIADSEAVKKAICKKEYQKALIKISVENLNLALTNNFYQSLIKKRIIMLNKSSSNKSITWKAILILPVLMVFLLLFNTKTVAQIQNEEPEKITSYKADSNFEISFEIKNTSKEEQLKAYSKMLEKNNVQLEFENVTRDAAGHITGITAKFLDKNNNSSGSITRQNNDGIKGFIVYYSEKEGAGFRSPSSTPGRATHNLLRDVGTEPLIIVEGKQYSTSQLKGKTIKVMGDVTSLPSTTALQTYGNAAKEGALVISKGVILDDFDAEMKEVDARGENVVRDYIRFENGKKPMFINVNKNMPVANSAKGTSSTIYSTAKPGEETLIVSGSNSAITLRDLYIPGQNPVYIVNGKVLGRDAVIDTINTANITGVNVLKGYSATAVYGKDAKDGAISITTRKAGDTTGFSFNTGNLRLRDSVNSKNVMYVASNVKFIELDSLPPSNRKFILTGANAQYYDAPLNIVDGKVMDADFNISSLGNSISSVVVIKGAAAVQKYGDEAKGGAVEITTARGTLVPTSAGNFEIVKSSATDQELKEAVKRIKNKTGIEVGFKNVKRNKAGLITGINVSAKHEGEIVTLTVSETGPVGDIYIGKVNNKLKVTTRP